MTASGRAAFFHAIFQKVTGLRGCQTPSLLGPGRDERDATRSQKLKEETRAELREQAVRLPSIRVATSGKQRGSQEQDRHPQPRGSGSLCFPAGFGAGCASPKRPAKRWQEASLTKELPDGFRVRC